VSDSEFVGIVGYGLLGRAIARRLLDAGYRVFAIDTNPSALSDPDDGVVPVSMAELVKQAATVVVAVYSADDVRDVIDRLSPIDAETRPGRTIICLTTLSPDDAREIEVVAQLAGFTFVEFPLSGTAAHVERGEALGLAGGAAAVIERNAPVLDVLVGDWIFVGVAGEAAKLKLAINLILEISRAALAEGIAFALHVGLDTKLIAAALPRSAARSAVMTGKLEKMLSADFSAEARLQQSLKDIGLIEQIGAAQRMAMPMTRAVYSLLERGVAEGHGALDSSAVLNLYFQPSQTAAAARC